MADIQEHARSIGYLQGKIAAQLPTFVAAFGDEDAMLADLERIDGELLDILEYVEGRLTAMDKAAIRDVGNALFS